MTIENRPRIGYHNLFREGTLTASSEQTGWEAARAVDWLTYDAWQPDANSDNTLQVQLPESEAADYVAFAKSIFDTCVVEYWNGASWETAVDFEATTEHPMMVLFDSVSADRWRIRVSRTGAPPIIGVVSLGRVLKFERGIYIGHGPEPLNPSNTYLNNTSEAGEYIGARVIRRGVNARIDVENLSRDWVYANWPDFQAHATTPLPFFWAWNLEEYPNHCSLVWPTGDPSASNTKHTKLMGCSIPVTGLGGYAATAPIVAT